MGIKLEYLVKDYCFSLDKSKTIRNTLQKTLDFRFESPKAEEKHRRL